MLSKKLESVLNEQVQKEGYAANLYLAMASWSETQGLEGVSNWFYAQHMEETDHMLRFVKFINERGGHAIIPIMEQPPKDFKGVKQVFEASLEHEQMVTKSINDIVGLALEEKDFTTHNWLQWFVDEQMEEESAVQSILDKLKLLGEGNLYLFDRDIMGMRATGAEE